MYGMELGHVLTPPAIQRIQGQKRPCDWDYPGGRELYRDVQLPRKQVGQMKGIAFQPLTHSVALINAARSAFLPSFLFGANDDRRWHKHGHVELGRKERGTYDMGGVTRMPNRTGASPKGSFQIRCPHRRGVGVMEKRT